MVTNDIKFISELKLKIAEDNLNAMTLDDLLKLKTELNRRIESKTIARLVRVVVDTLEQSKSKVIK